MAINPLQLEELREIEEQKRFEITDLSSLNWALRKLAAIEAKKAEVNKLADAEIERIESYRTRELEGLQRSEDFFKSLIAEYAVRRRLEDPKFKSESTPYGRIGFRKQQPKWHYNDEEVTTFLEKEHPDLIRVKKEPIKNEIKARFKVTDDGKVYDDNGQEVPGIKVEFLPDTLDVKVDGV